MEQLNRIELRGIVGAVRESKVGELILVNMSVATNYVYRGKDGVPVIETTWHSVAKCFEESPGIQKGDRVEVIGRLKNERYIRADGSEVYTVRVSAKSITKIEEHLTMEE